MLGVILFFFGLFIGSFLGVIIDRLPRGETFFRGRSHCEYCKHTLAWYDLIPLVSYLILFGKCRYCKKFIGWKYPIIEVSTGILFSLASIFLANQESIMYQVVSIKYIIVLAYYVIIVSSLIVIFFIDLFDGIIPDIILLIMGFVSFSYLLLTTYYLLPSHILSAVIAFALFLFLTIITKGKGMGLGDVKFAFVIGLMLGFPGSFIALYVAFISGAGISLFLLMKKKKKMTSTIAFGPYLVFGSLLGLLWGNVLWNTFLHILLKLPYP